MTDGKRSALLGGDFAPYGIAVIVLAAAFGPSFTGQRTEPQGAAKSPPVQLAPAPAKGSAALGATREHVVQILGEFYGLPPEASPAATPPTRRSARSPTPSLALDPIALWKATPDARVLIATVPDPAESKLGFMADRHIDFIEAALGEQGFILDRFWLPWRVDGDRTEERTAISIGQSGDPSLVTTRSVPTSRGHTQPGVMLFRDPDGVPVLMLLVGESPISGVMVPALSVAFDLARELSPSARLSIAGPTFSGGGCSLAKVLSTRLKRDPKFEVDVVSGTLTSRAPATELHSLERSFKGRVTFKDLEVPIDVSEPVLCEFATAHGAHAGNTALLVESSTAFGAGAIDQLGSQPCPVATHEGRNQPLVMRYPLHVALARSGYDKLARRDGSDPVHNIEARTAIDLPLGLMRAGDVVPSFVPEHAAVVSERLLIQELDTLRARRVRFVGIFGTDPYDRIFLARLVRRRIPDAQLFTIGADVLYLHPAFTADLLNMWVASTDPIDPALELAPLRRGLPNRDTMYSAPNFLAAGGGRAVLELLAPGSVPFADKVWLTAVGQEGFWPLRQENLKDRPNARLQEFQGSATARPATSRPRVERRDAASVPTRARRSGLLWLPMLATGVLGLLLANVVFSVHTGFDRGKRNALRIVSRLPSLARVLRATPWRLRASDGSSLEDFRRLIGPPLGINAVWRLGLLLPPCVLLAFWLFIARGGLFPGGEEKTLPGLGALAGADWVLLGSVLVAACALVCLGLGAISSEARATHGLLDRREAGESETVTVVGAGLVAFALMSVLLVGVGGLVVEVGFPRDLRTSALTDALRNLVDLVPPPDLYLFERAANLGNGLSPIVPSGLLAIGVLVLAAAAAQRRRLRSYIGWVGSVLPDDRSAELRAMHATGVGLVEGIESPKSVTAFLERFLPPVLVTLVAWLILSSGFTWSIEGQPFDIVMGGTILLLIGCITSGWLRFLELWRHLRRFLHATAQAPFAAAFDDLPEELAHTFGLRVSERPLDVAQVPLADTARKKLARTLAGRAHPLAGAAAEALPLPEAHALLSVAPPLFATRAGDQLAALAGRVLCDSQLRGILLADRFVAMEITRFISYVFAFLKNLALSSTAATLVLLFAVGSYPLQPQQRLLTLSLIGVVVTATLMIRTLVQLERNELLSRIANRTPNRVDFDREFFSLVATYAGIPALSLLVTRLPALGNVFGWFSH